MIDFDVVLRARLDLDGVHGAVARGLGVSPAEVESQTWDVPWDVRLEVIPLDRGFGTIVRLSVRGDAERRMPTVATFAARLAASLQTDVVIDPETTPGLVPERSGLLLIRPSGEGLRVVEDYDREDADEEEDVFFIDERPETMRSIGKIPT